MTLTLERARELAPLAVATQGRDFVYTLKGSGCFYTPLTSASDDDPRKKTSCLVGVILDMAGVTIHHVSGAYVGTLHRASPGVMTDEAATYLQIMQAAQDNGETWGDAHDQAEESVS